VGGSELIGQSDLDVEKHFTLVNPRGLFGVLADANEVTFGLADADHVRGLKYGLSRRGVKGLDSAGGTVLLEHQVGLDMGLALVRAVQEEALDFIGCGVGGEVDGELTHFLGAKAREHAVELSKHSRDSGD